MYYNFNSVKKHTANIGGKDRQTAGGAAWRRNNGKRLKLSGFLKRAGKVFKHDTKLGHYLHKHKGTAALGAAGAIMLAKKLMDDKAKFDTYQDAIMNNRGLRRKIMGIY